MAHLDWGTIPDWASAVLTGLSIIVAAKIGLRAWKNQLRGTKEYALAVRLMKDVYRVRDAVKTIRNPWMDSAEGSGNADEEWTISAYQKRWEGFNKANEDLRADLVEAEVHWDSELKEVAERLRKHVNKLYIATRHYITSVSRKNPPRGRDIFSDRDEKVLYEIENDDYDTELTEIIAEFENRIKTHIRSF